MQAATRERLHFLVDGIPEDELEAAQRFLDQHAADPVLLALANAPEDDESLAPEEEAAIREGEAAVERGEVEPWESVRDVLLRQVRSSERMPRSSEITCPAKKDLAGLPSRDQAAMIDALDRLADDSTRADFLKLVEYANRWRLRVDDWRANIAADKQGGLLRVLRVLPRSRAYQG